MERSGSWLHDEVEYFLDVEMEVRAKRSRWCFDFEIWYWDWEWGWDTYSRQLDKTVDRASLFFPAGADVMAQRLFCIGLD